MKNTKDTLVSLVVALVVILVVALEERRVRAAEGPTTADNPTVV